MIFHNYQSSPIDNNEASPNLEILVDYMLKRWGGQNLGIFGKRNSRGSDKPSTHWSGAALDFRYANPGPGRAVCLNEIIPTLESQQDRLGIQAIHDYAGGRIWRVNRPSGPSGWVAQKVDNFGMGQSWALWLHIEVHPDNFWDDRPVEEKVLGTIATGGWPPFVPESGQFSLWPFNTNKPVVKVGSTGDAVRYVQGVMRHKLGWGVAVDGNFGNGTKLHVVQLQVANGLVGDGIVGPKTYEVLDWAALHL